MASWNRTMLRSFARQGIVIKEGKLVKVKKTDAEARKERHDKRLKEGKNVHQSIYASNGKFARQEGEYRK